jgi:N utilization substance protein B
VDTRDPRRSRERALKILFQADIRGEAASDLLARIADDPRAWAMLDDLDPDEGADLAPTVDAAAADADAEPHLVAAEARRRKALELDGFTRSLVQGVADRQAELDELIQIYARRWTVARMPAIDRNLLRLGAYELSHEVTSPAVVINEVIELAKALSTEDSGRYVNGVLEAIRKHLADRRAAGPEPADARAEPRIEPVVPDAVDPVDRGEEPPAATPAVAEPEGAAAPVDTPADASDAPSDPVEPVDPVDPVEPVDDGDGSGQQQLF